MEKEIVLFENNGLKNALDRKQVLTVIEKYSEALVCKADGDVIPMLWESSHDDLGAKNYFPKESTCFCLIWQ